MKVFNAIDWKSTEIHISVNSDYSLRVTDDGRGIRKEKLDVICE